MDTFKWSELTPLQLGRYAEYLVKMEFTKLKIPVFSAELDDRGIDFVIRTEKNTTQKPKHYDVQVKAVRNLNYVFFHKDKPSIAENVFVALALFADRKEPDLYLIPTTVWRDPNRLFVDRKYKERGLKSRDEYGLNLNKTTVGQLAPYEFSKTATNLS